MSDFAKDINVPTNDCISRQAAIDALVKAIREDPYYDSNEAINGLGVCDVRVILNDLPSAQPEQQWIPVSEGLPKKDGRYQVTRHDDVTNTEFIDILWYEKNTWWNRQATGDYAVTAWMPLPEPYQAERREDG